MALTARLGSERGVSLAPSSTGSRQPASASAAWTVARQALVIAALRGDEDAVHDTADRLSPRFSGKHGPVTVGVGGRAEVFRQVGTRSSTTSAGRAHLVPDRPAAAVLVFGSVVAAGLPLLDRGSRHRRHLRSCCVILASFTQVSIFSLNLTTALGLGLAIDYSLFIVSRYREELRRGLDPARRRRPHRCRPPAAPCCSARSPWPSSLAALLVFPLHVPAVVRVRGHRRGRPGRRRRGRHPSGAARGARAPRRLAGAVPRRRAPKPVARAFWHRLATFVMRRPVPSPSASSCSCWSSASPFLQRRLRPARRPGAAVRPPRAARCRTTSGRTSPRDEVSALRVVAPALADPTHAADDRGYAAALSQRAGRGPGRRRHRHLRRRRAGRPAGPRSRALRRAPRHLALASSRPSSRYSDAGERLVHDVRADAAAVPASLVGGAVGPARRLQGVALRPAAARGRPDRAW